MMDPYSQGPMGPSMQGPPAPEPQQVSPVEHLRLAIEHAQASMVGEPSDGDSQTIAKVIQALYSILATRQKQTQQVMGNPAAQQVIGRAMQPGG